jgi:hypothetical protein
MTVYENSPWTAAVEVSIPEADTTAAMALAVVALAVDAEVLRGLQNQKAFLPTESGIANASLASQPNISRWRKKLPTKGVGSTPARTKQRSDAISFSGTKMQGSEKKEQYWKTAALSLSNGRSQTLRLGGMRAGLGGVYSQTLTL